MGKYNLIAQEDCSEKFMSFVSDEITAPASLAYISRPWLKLYPSHVSSDIIPQFGSGLEMFLTTVRTAPDRPAIHYFNQSLSYGELDRQSTALAAALIDQGVTRGDRVALLLQNIPPFLIALYSIWKAGGIVVLCNPMYKQKELEYHLNDSSATGLICLESLYSSVVAPALPATAVRFVITTSELDYLKQDSLPEMLQSSNKQRFEQTLDMLELINRYAGVSFKMPVLQPQDVAFLTYTSGTTGQPKGAMNTHANVVYNATVIKIWMGLDDSDVVVGVAPFFHITGLISHLAVAALAGMPVIMFYRFDPAQMLSLIEQWRGTFTVAAITVYIALMNHPEIKKYNLSSFTKVYSGGAPVSPAIVENFERLTGAYIHNTYGLTETTSPSHAIPAGKRAPVDSATGALSVGLPLPGNICRIVDVATGHDLPVGEIGELITSGPEVVAGYWQKPEETAHAIRNGYLYTGDVAKMDQAGWFYLVDRKKDMIIASGYKVWPREVEDVLYQHPAVREAGVVGVPDAYRGETVKAFVALKSGFEQGVTALELMDFCKERLANYKYPREIEFMDELPKTITGKYLRRELRAKPAL